MIIFIFQMRKSTEKHCNFSEVAQLGSGGWNLNQGSLAEDRSAFLPSEIL